jgi:ATP-dependent Lon protease
MATELPETQSPESGAQETQPPESGAQEIQPSPRVLAILPQPDLVLFPRLIMPVVLWDDSSQKLVQDALFQDKIFGLLASRGHKVEGYGPEDLYEVGTAAVILKMRKAEDDSVRLLVQGLYRFRVEEWLGFAPYFAAKIAPVSEEYEPDLELEALASNVKGLFVKMMELSPTLPVELGTLVRDLGDPRILADVTAGSLNISKTEKQELLETLSVKERLRRILTLVSREIEILELGKKIQAEVKVELDKAQKEYYLREHIKVLQRELGEGEEKGREIEELQFRLEEADLPPHAKKEAQRELTRLNRTPPTSPDHQVIRNYLEWMIELPWSKATEDNLDLAQARKILDDDHYDLEKVKKRTLEYLAVRQLKPDMKGPILCFVGPPGTGKTSLGRSIARALGRKFVRLSLGGVRDEAEIRGHRRTYVGALPGRIIQSMRRAGSNNPVFILDEVDKIGADFRGDPSSALLEVLDPEQNFSFSDHYLDVGFDLSKVMFITTANLLDPIPPALRDRMEVLELVGYTEEEKLDIAFSFLIPRQLEAHGLTAAQLEISPGVIRLVIASYTREAGLRNLEREIASLCRGAAREIAEGVKTHVVINEAEVAPYLGPPRFFREAALDHPEPGVATGLAWTPAGGELLFIEVLRMPGKSHLKLTGQLGDVMKESANAALSYIRARAPFLGIEEDFFESADLHIHVPAGAIPKDGPSAGLALLCALVSLLSNRPIKKGLAMTGEITLRGHVLPVGGIKNKVLAAHRAGIKEIIIPTQNQVDLEEIPAPVRQDLLFYPVATLEQALEIAFPPQ